MDIWYDFHVSTREQASHFGGRCRCSSQSLSVKWKETLASLGCQHSQASCRHAALLLAALLRLWPRCGISILSQDFLCGKRLYTNFWMWWMSRKQTPRNDTRIHKNIWVGELVTRSLTQMDRRFRLSSCSLNGPRDRGNGLPQSQKSRRYKDAMWPYVTILCRDQTWSYYVILQSWLISRSGDSHGFSLIIKNQNHIEPVCKMVKYTEICW